ncbi:hypothetical protein Pelo_17227 [Pelomyxa schiedti]|nr:hypothetical protein Pelo_17227 [Pelomyxa schiedti]
MIHSIDAPPVVTVLRKEVIHEGKKLCFYKSHFIDQEDKNTERVYECFDRTTRGGNAVDGVDMVGIVSRKGHPDCILLVVQYRNPVRTYALEFPSGTVNPGEDLEAAARRELLEETGFHGGDIVSRSPVVAYDCGLTSDNSVLYVMKIDGDAPENLVPQQHLDEDEHIGVLQIPCQSLMQTVQAYSKAGYSIDAKICGQEMSSVSYTGSSSCSSSSSSPARRRVVTTGAAPPPIIDSATKGTAASEVPVANGAEGAPTSSAASSATAIPSPSSSSSSSTSSSSSSSLAKPSKSPKLAVTRQEWSAPRKILYFDNPPKLTVEEQGGLCQGCGADLAAQGGGVSAPRARLCEYTQRYFCTLCHQNKRYVIPARILRNWDFRPYPVSNFAFGFLRGLFEEPAFDISAINPSLYTSVPVLADIHDKRHQLCLLKQLIQSCPAAAAPKLCMQRLPHYLIDSMSDMYSLQDLTNAALLRDTLHEITEDWAVHVATCRVCREKGVKCSVCTHGKLLYDFMMHSVVKCKHCSALFHRDCIVSHRDCPKCNKRL